jgi:hypothetical protein
MFEPQSVHRVFEYDQIGRGAADCGEYCEAAGAIVSLKQQAHRVLRPVGHSLLMNASNYCCFVGWLDFI